MARITRADAYRALEELIANLAALASAADGEDGASDEDVDWGEFDRAHRRLCARLTRIEQQMRDA
jgi:hypothetical protein